MYREIQTDRQTETETDRVSYCQLLSKTKPNSKLYVLAIGLKLQMKTERDRIGDIDRRTDTEADSDRGDS